jgi:hypothetical protein
MLNNKLLWVCLFLFFGIDGMLYYQYTNRNNEVEKLQPVERTHLTTPDRIGPVSMREEKFFPKTEKLVRQPVQMKEPTKVEPVVKIEPQRTIPTVCVPIPKEVAAPKVEKPVNWEAEWEKERQ